MAKILVSFEVNPGETDCGNCPFYECDCVERGLSVEFNCQKYDLSTLRAIDMKEEKSC